MLSRPLYKPVSKILAMPILQRNMALTSKVISYTSRWSPLKVQEIPIKEPVKPTQLVIKLTHIGLNPIDIKLKSIAVVPMRYTVGKDFSGHVELVGSALTSQFSVGERVCGGLLNPLDGFVGTRALLDVKKHAIIKPPEHLTDAQAAAFPLTWGTAYEMIQRTQALGPDSAVLVLGGATNVGSYAIQILKKKYKIGRVVATCSRSSADYVRSLGADDTVDYRDPDISNALIVSASPTKYQAILDTVGGYDALRVWPELLQPYETGATYITIAGDAPPSDTYAKSMIKPMVNAPWIVTRILLGRRFGINYQLVSAKKGGWTNEAEAFFEDKSVQIPIDSVTRLEDFELAWDKLNRLGAQGKVLIDVNEDQQ